MNTRLALVALVALFGSAASADAQNRTAQSPPQFVDRVVAIVGDSVILDIDLSVHVLKLQAGVNVPPDSASRAAFRRQALDNLITETLVVQAAARDTLIIVDAERVEEELQAWWDGQVRAFGTEANLRQEIARVGMTPAQYRESSRVDLRNQLMREQYVALQQQSLRMPPIEEAEIRAFFERESPSLDARPAMTAFRQVVIVPQPSDSARAAARTEAERILALIREGEDFAELARRFSDDGSAANGGDFGWYRPGQTVPEFDEALFRLARGQMSGVVETVYGAHIIRLERVRGGERNGRHILIGAETTPADVDRARSRAQEVRTAVAAGTSILDFENEGADLGLPQVVSERPIADLPGAYPVELRGARTGDVLGPIDVPIGTTTAFAIVEVTSVRDAGQWSYEDFRDQIRGVLQDEMFRDRLVEKLRAETYVEIRD